ncbi:P-loop containing nucleoside triphosphate hydrolase protein [Scleroderma yunnanense]
MGLTGTGKSSFVSMITGNQEQGVGHSLTSCTREIKTAKCTIEGSSVVLLDTPGFNHPEISDLKILQLITSWLNKTCKQGPLLSILYFHRITDNRMLWTPLKDFQRLCRNKPISNIVLTTTMWDEVDEDFGDERLKELRGNDWKTIFRYSNTQESAKEVLLQLMAVTEGN